MAMSTTVINTDDFRYISRKGIRKKFNQLPSDELLTSLDPEGTHVLVFSMVHNDDHMRTMWMVKTLGWSPDTRPPEVLLDMSFEDFRSLRSIRLTEDGEWEVVDDGSEAG